MYYDILARRDRKAINDIIHLLPAWIDADDRPSARDNRIEAVLRSQYSKAIDQIAGLDTWVTQNPAKMDDRIRIVLASQARRAYKQLPDLRAWAVQNKTEKNNRIKSILRTQYPKLVEQLSGLGEWMTENTVKKDRRIKAVLVSRCRHAIRQIPSLAEWVTENPAEKDERIRAIIHSKCSQAIGQITDLRQWIIANPAQLDQRIKAVLYSQCAPILQQIKDILLKWVNNSRGQEKYERLKKIAIYYASRSFQAFQEIFVDESNKSLIERLLADKEISAPSKRHLAKLKERGERAFLRLTMEIETLTESELSIHSVEKEVSTEEPSELKIFGDSDCMYYAYAVSLLYYLRYKKDPEITTNIFNKLGLNVNAQADLFTFLGEAYWTNESIKQTGALLVPSCRALAATRLSCEMKENLESSSLAEMVAIHFRKLLAKQVEGLGQPLTKRLDVSGTDILNIPKLKSAMAAFIDKQKEIIKFLKNPLTCKNNPALATYVAYLEVSKESPEQYNQVKASIEEHFIKTMVLAFFKQDNYLFLDSYADYLKQSKVLGGEEMILALHRAITGESLQHKHSDNQGRVDLKLTVYHNNQPARGVEPKNNDRNVDFLTLNKSHDADWIAVIPAKQFKIKNNLIAGGLFFKPGQGAAQDLSRSKSLLEKRENPHAPNGNKYMKKYCFYQLPENKIGTRVIKSDIAENFARNVKQ